MLLVVVDANIVFSSLISGRESDLLFSRKLKLVAPELLFVELKKHKDELLSKSRLSVPEFELLLALIEKRIPIVPLKEFISLMPDAEKLLGTHVKDAPYVALALKLNCPLWSYEKLFTKIGPIESLTTKDLLKRLRT